MNWKFKKDDVVNNYDHVLIITQTVTSPVGNYYQFFDYSKMMESMCPKEELERVFTIKHRRIKDEVIDQMNASKESTVILRPGEKWEPLANKVETNPEEKCYHIWRKVTLFSSTVEECEKCGVLRE